jgi:four helix bundle protein
MTEDREEKQRKKKEFKARLYRFILELIKFINQLPRNQVTKVINDQLLRSSTSILANYIEGLSASSKKEFLVFIQHSLKSANESKVWIALLRDAGYTEKQRADFFLKELEEISKIFASTILTLRSKKSI